MPSLRRLTGGARRCRHSPGTCGCYGRRSRRGAAPRRPRTPRRPWRTCRAGPRSPCPCLARRVNADLPANRDLRGRPARLDLRAHRAPPARMVPQGSPARPARRDRQAPRARPARRGKTEQTAGTAQTASRRCRGHSTTAAPRTRAPGPTRSTRDLPGTRAPAHPRSHHSRPRPSLRLRSSGAATTEAGPHPLRGVGAAFALSGCGGCRADLRRDLRLTPLDGGLPHHRMRVQVHDAGTPHRLGVQQGALQGQQIRRERVRLHKIRIRARVNPRAHPTRLRPRALP